MSTARDRLGNERVDGVHQFLDALGLLGIGGILVGRQGRTTDHRRVIARESVLVQQLANFELDQIQQLRIIHQVAFVQKHDQRRNVHLASQQHVLASLRHGAVGGRHDQDRTVHLSGTRDHVFDVVGVARAIDMSVVPLVAFILDVGNRNGHRLGVVADSTALGDIRIRLELWPCPSSPAQP